MAGRFSPTAARDASRRVFRWTFVVLTLGFVVAPPAAPAWPGSLTLNVTDEKTGQQIPFRMHLKNQASRPVKPPGLPFWGDHFSAPGKVEFKVPKGNYSFEIECGPEYLHRAGHFTMYEESQDTKTLTMKRFVNLSEKGWYAGDLYMQRSPRDLEMVMQAEQLHVAPVVMWHNKKTEEIPPTKIAKDPEVGSFDYLTTLFDKNRVYSLSAGKDERLDNELLYFHLKTPLPVLNIPAKSSSWPPTESLLEQARSQDWAWVDASKPFWMDLPLWVALGKVNSIQLAHRDFLRDGPANAKASTPGRPRSMLQFGGVRGEGLYTQTVYYHLLNSGLRIPPSAGSGTGVVNNPAGYNRVYVYVEGDFTYEKWWDGLRAGRCFVTNGPLILPTVDGQYPGISFSGSEGDELEYEIAVTLHTREKIEYLEVIQNGELRHSLRLDEFAKEGGRLPKLKFKESGWFLLRAMCENPKTFRFASSAPFYVNIGGKSRISKTSVQFFLDWLTEREAQLKLTDPAQKEAWKDLFLKAREFWQDRLDRANAE